MQQCRTIQLLRNRRPRLCYQGNLTCDSMLGKIRYTYHLFLFPLLISLFVLYITVPHLEYAFSAWKVVVVIVVVVVVAAEMVVAV
jgi:Na+/citrate or Na+/malate symporter